MVIPAGSTVRLAERAQQAAMYIPKHFEGSEAHGREIMQAHAWALLSTADESGAPLCTHLVLQWEDDGSPHGCLIGHMARANEHWKLFARDVPSLALFWGPHAYVSPTWYTPGPKVPTWNYVTVHAYGRPQLIEATPAVLMVLTRLAAQYDGSGVDAWGLGRLPPGNAAGQTQNICPSPIPLSRIETKLKLSQNRELADRHNVIEKLSASDS